MNPDLFSRMYRMYSIDDQSEYFSARYHSLPSEIDEPVDEPFHQPTESIAVNSDTLTLNVEYQISQTQMEQMIADFVRVFGFKPVLNAVTSQLNRF